MLSENELSQFKTKGYLKCDSLFGVEELSLMRSECERLLALDWWDQRNIRTRFKNFADNDQAYREALDPVCDLSPVFAQVRDAPVILDRLAQIFDDGPLNLKDKLLFKPPKGTGYDLHQDYIAWPEFPKTCVVALVALDPSSPESGGLEVFPGFERILSPADGAYYNLDPAVLSGTPSEWVTLAPGDVFFFNCLVPHRSGVNTSQDNRRHLYLTYHPASEGNLRKAYYAKHLRWVQEALSAEAYFE